MRYLIGRDEFVVLAFVIPLAAIAGYMAAHRLETPALRLEGQVTHIRDGDTIEVSGVPVRIANNLDCAERGTAAGDSATALMRQMASSATASCALEGHHKSRYRTHPPPAMEALPIAISFARGAQVGAAALFPAQRARGGAPMNLP